MAPTSEASIFPFPASTASEVPAKLAWLRENEPFTRVTLASGHEAWLATRYRDVRRIFGDPRFVVPDGNDPASPRLDPTLPAHDLPLLRALNPPDHRRLRDLVQPAFTMRRVERLRPLVQGVADRLLDDIAAAGPPADLVSGFTDPLPPLAMCAWLELPEEEAGRILNFNAEVTSAAPADEIQRVQREMAAHAAELIAARRAAPGDDLLSMLIAARDEHGAMSDEEMYGLVFSLAFAGQSTLSDLLAAALNDLLHQPERWRRLREDPDRARAAAEEMTRVHTVLKDGHLRIAAQDVDFGDVTIRAGDAVVVSVSSANQDETVFPDPTRLDLERADKPHLTFGHGIHRCIAAAWNRVQIQVGLTSVITRFPGIRAASVEQDPAWRSKPRMHGVAELPVLW